MAITGPASARGCAACRSSSAPSPAPRCSRRWRRRGRARCARWSASPATRCYPLRAARDYRPPSRNWIWWYRSITTSMRPRGTRTPSFPAPRLRDRQLRSAAPALHGRERRPLLPADLEDRRRHPRRLGDRLRARHPHPPAEVRAAAAAAARARPPPAGARARSAAAPRAAQADLAEARRRPARDALWPIGPAPRRLRAHQGWPRSIGAGGIRRRSAAAREVARRSQLRRAGVDRPPQPAQQQLLDAQPARAGQGSRPRAPVDESAGRLAPRAHDGREGPGAQRCRRGRDPATFERRGDAGRGLAAARIRAPGSGGHPSHRGRARGSERQRAHLASGRSSPYWGPRS